MKQTWNHPMSSRNELKTCEIGLGGRNSLDFGTVRPRVQIPGPPTKIRIQSFREPLSRCECTSTAIVDVAPASLTSPLSVRLELYRYGADSCIEHLDKTVDLLDGDHEGR